MLSSSKFILSAFLLAVVVRCCDINIKVKLDSVHPFYAQFTFFNETKSRMYLLDFDHPVKNLKIKGMFCALKPTILKVWKEEKPKSEDVKPFGETQAFIEGMGNITYTISSDDRPTMSERFGTMCSFGDCGRG